MNPFKKLSHYLKAFIKFPLEPRPVQLFTYYIPAPPPRSIGYQEKELDKVLGLILHAGFKIRSLQTESHSSSHHGGMWVIATFWPPKGHTKYQSIRELISSQEKLSADSGNNSLSPVEGIYYEKDFSKFNYFGENDSS